MVKISALISDVIVKPLKQDHRFTSAIRSALSACHATLQASELGLCRPEPSRVFDLNAIVESGKRGQSDINADHVRTERQRRGLAFDHEQGEPASGFAFDRERFNGAFNRAVQLDSDVPDFRDSQPVSFQGVADLAKRHAVVASHGAESRIARFLAILNAAKERTKGQVNALENVLQHVAIDCCHVFTRWLNLSELQVLIEPRNRFALTLPRFPAFLNRRVVEFAAHRKLIIQAFLLALSGVDPVFEGLDQRGPILSFGVFS